jgi:hypothetical protein
MTFLNFDPNMTKTVEGVEYVAIMCWKCGGRAYLPGYEHVDNARCWGECHGRPGPLGWRTRADYERVLARRAKDEERRAKKAREEAERFAAEKAAERKAFVEANGDLVAALEAYDGHSRFVLEARTDVVRDGETLTDAQVAALWKAITDEAERLAKEIEVPEGRQVVEVEVLKVRDEEDTFSPYGGTVWKMLVQADGFRLYGSVPSSIVGAIERGSRVRFTATLQPKETGFGFYKRPTKAEVLEPASA